MADYGIACRTVWIPPGRNTGIAASVMTLRSVQTIYVS